MTSFTASPPLYRPIQPNRPGVVRYSYNEINIDHTCEFLARDAFVRTNRI